MRISCRASRFAQYWWLLIHLLLLAIPFMSHISWLSVSIMLGIIISGISGWYQVQQYQPDFSLRPPDSVTVHQSAPHHYSVSSRSFHHRWFCCLHLRSAQQSRWVVIFNDAVNPADFHAIARVIWLLPAP